MINPSTRIEDPSMRFARLTPALLAFGLPGWSIAADSPKPQAVAATRPEMKELLEGSKRSKPRLPLPPPTEEELAKAKAQPGRGPMGGIVNNGRMRRLYLPPEFVSGGFSREPDPSLTLSPTLKTMFFWIVSRANNCYYCQGHQEVKLAADGVTEDTLAALDGDWSEFTPAERAAFAFTKAVTYHPEKVTDADIDRLRAHYKDAQIVEILLTVAGNNAMNRWTGALAIPQEDHRAFLTPTSEKFRAATSKVAPLASGLACAAPADRGPLEPREKVEAALAAAKTRSPRLPLVDDEKARALLPSDWPSGPVPAWARVLLNFPKHGKDRVVMHRATEERGTLDPKLRAAIAWVSARNDRAWYALGQAKHRLAELGLSEDAIYGIDAPGDKLPEGDKLALAFARKLTVDPALITDADIEGLRKHFSDRQVAEIVFQVTESAFFDRLTEAAGLPSEG
jgi:alkylhydroperoxidase family enzyme